MFLRRPALHAQEIRERFERAARGLPEACETGLALRACPLWVDVATIAIYKHRKFAASSMNFRLATLADAAQLALMNQQLIRDEGHRNAMDLAQLIQRMEGWLDGGYQGVVFEAEALVIGYALFRVEADGPWIRQLFVAQEWRRKGVGREALRWLSLHIWPNVRRLRIEVLTGNNTARQFWRSVGFDEYSVTMEAAMPVADRTGVDDRAP
jgi:GNAT superfamily N-acetyltransferase